MMSGSVDVVLLADNVLAVVAPIEDEIGSGSDRIWGGMR